MGLGSPRPEAVETVEVWAAHVPAVEAWRVVSGQWRVAAVGGGLAPARLRWLGLDAAACKAALDMAGIVLGPGVWGQVQLIALGAREEMER